MWLSFHGSAIDLWTESVLENGSTVRTGTDTKADTINSEDPAYRFIVTAFGVQGAVPPSTYHSDSRSAAQPQFTIITSSTEFPLGVNRKWL